MRRLLPTTSHNSDFLRLVKLLDADLAISDGEDHAFYNQYNKLDHIKHVVVAYENEVPVGCGAIKALDDNTFEIKRMYVLPAYRGKGIAQDILTALEAWAQQLGADRCILETGLKQPQAIALYKKSGYHITENYGQYTGVENSLCFEKILPN